MAEQGREDQKLKVFISYSRRDCLEFADQLEAALQTCGFATSIDRHGISGGADWQERLGELIREADTVVFVLSPEAAESGICRWEVAEARRLSKRILPIIAVALGTARPPEYLQSLNYVFFYAEPTVPGSGFGTGLAGLIKALNTDVDWLKEHTRLLGLAAAWAERERPSNRLLTGTDIGEAKAWAGRKPHAGLDLGTLVLDFIRVSEEWQASQQSEERRRLEERERLVREAEIAQSERDVAQKAREAAQRDAVKQAQKVVRRTRWFLAGVLVALLVVTSVGVWAWLEQQEAVRQTFRAENSEAETKKVTEGAQFTESGLLANAANQLTSLGRDEGTVALLALEGLQDDASSDPRYRARRDTAEAQFELDRALRNLHEHAVLAGHTGRVTIAGFSPDGTRIVTASDDQTAQVWNATTGKTVARLEGHKASVVSAAFSADRHRV